MTRGQLNPSCEGNVKYLPRDFFYRQKYGKIEVPQTDFG